MLGLLRTDGNQNDQEGFMRRKDSQEIGSLLEADRQTEGKDS